jgi:hypothetical protein
MTSDDDWTAAAADRMIRQTRLAADRLRNSGIRPLGLAPGSYPPMPARVRGETYGPAADRRAGGVVVAVTIRYGDATDRSATVLDVTSDFTPDFESRCPLRYELGRARHEYDAIARGELEISDPVGEPGGPFGSGKREILVSGAAEGVRIVTCGDYRAFRFESGGVHVTAVGRYELPGRLCFEPITDLTRYLPGEIDREELRRQLRAHRAEPPR